MKNNDWTKQRSSQGKFPTYMPVQCCVGSKRPSPYIYEPVILVARLDWSNRKNHIPNPTKAEIQNPNGAKDVDDINPAIK